MTHELDNIIAELCAFDAELAKGPVLVRRLVEELQRSKPPVVVDDAFRTQLRTALLATPVLPTPRRVVPWWLLYTAPVGVVALVLMLVGTALDPSSPMNPSNIPTAPEDTVMKMSPMMSSDASTSGVDSAVMERTGTILTDTDYFTALLTVDTVEVPYLTTSQPSYIVVTDTAGVVVAVSELYAPGEHMSATFATRVPFMTATIYTATLYYDNGDGVYTIDSDEVATDNFGTVVSLPLTLP